MRDTPILLALLATLAAAAPAQVTTVDEGRFLISRGGQRVGSEDFAIRRTPGPGGGTLVANGAVTYDDHRLATAAAVIGLVVDGIQITDIATTVKTLPDFPGMWKQMLAGAAH